MKRTKIIRAALFCVGGAGWLVYALPLFIGGIANYGTAFGMVFFGTLFLIAVSWKKFTSFMNRKRKKKSFRVLSDVFFALVAVGLAVMLAVSGFMIRAAHNGPPAGTDLVVLGCKVRGTVPSKMLSRRISAAKEYLDANPDAVAVLSGGQGKDEDISEAQCMFEELTALGISPDRLILEDRSRSTRENIAFSYELLSERGAGPSVAIVTDGFHQLRASMLCRDVGLDAYSVSAETPPGLVVVYWTREIFGVVAEAVF